MLEIIALIYLSRQIGNIAIQKGLKPGQWKLYTILTWIVFELLGLVLAFMLFGFDKQNLLGPMAFALACAFGGYLLVKSNLEKRPDVVNDDDIENLGNQ